MRNLSLLSKEELNILSNKKKKLAQATKLNANLNNYLNNIVIQKNNIVNTTNKKMKGVKNMNDNKYKEEKYIVPNFNIDPYSVKNLGKYADIRLEYLKKNKNKLFWSMLERGILPNHLRKIDVDARKRKKQIVDGLKMVYKVEDEERKYYPMEWDRRMDNINKRAEKIVLNEIIYT